MTLKEDIQLICLIKDCLSESTNHEVNVIRLHKAKQILEEKMKNASKEGKEYLKRQYDIVSKKHDDELNKHYQIKSIHDSIMNKINKEKALEQMRQAQAQETNANSDYDPNNTDHQKIISQYHKVNMEKVRAAKNLKEDEAQDNEEMIKLAKIRIREKIENSKMLQKNSANNLRMSKQKMVNQATISK